MSRELNENVIKFFELYNSDSELRGRVQKAEAEYPGCLEIRDAVVRDVLIPIAKDMGLEFSLSDLRKYETRIKMQRLNEEECDEDASPFWLLDRGWEDDPDIFKTDDDK